MSETIAKLGQYDLSSRPNYVYGLKGLADLLGCSKQTAHKIKDSGQIPFAKIGKKFIFNEEKVMEALSNSREEAQHG
jgi:excisionase family DNA binding protein